MFYLSQTTHVGVEIERDVHSSGKEGKEEGEEEGEEETLDDDQCFSLGLKLG